MSLCSHRFCIFFILTVDHPNRKLFISYCRCRKLSVISLAVKSWQHLLSIKEDLTWIFEQQFPVVIEDITPKTQTVFLSSAPRWLWESEKSRETTKSTLAEYCQKVISLPPHISRCKHLSNFFKVRQEDENPPAPNTSVHHARLCLRHSS